MDQAGELVAFGAALRFEDIPAPVVERAKSLLIDTIAVAVAGASAPGIAPLVEQVREWGGRAQSSIIGFPDRCSPPDAAFVNGAMAHALDYDDTHDDAHLHANVCVVPALLAVAQAHRASGRDLLTAHIAGLELASRLALAGRPDMPHGWLPTTIFGGFGATTSVGRLMKLTPEVFRHALGIYYSHAGGNRQGLLDGALTKRIQPGMYAKAAVISASLARRGITGARNILDGAYGLYPMFVGQYDLSALTQDLASQYELMNIGLKPYPSCRATHRPIDGALRLLREHGFAPEEVAAVRVSLNTEMERDLVGNELQLGENVQVNAQFSVQYTVANALFQNGVRIADFTDEAIRNGRKLDLARRIQVTADPSRPVSVDIDLKNGRSVHAVVPYATGHARFFLSREQLRDKVLDCFAQAGLDDTCADEMIAAVDRIEEVSDVSPFLAALGTGSQPIPAELNVM